MNSLDDEGIHNLDNATEAMEVEFGKSKRARYDESSVKNGEMLTIHTIIYQVNMHTWEQKEENLKSL
jgi:hypothetical protein